MNLSLIGEVKIDTRTFAEWCNLDHFEEIESLIKSGWVELEPIWDMLSLHPILSDLVYKELKPESKVCRSFLQGTINYVKESASKSYSERRQAINFIQKVMNRILGEDEIIGDLFALLGAYLGKRKEALGVTYLLKALAIYKKYLGSYSIKGAEIYLNLAKAYQGLIWDDYVSKGGEGSLWEIIETAIENYLQNYKESLSLVVETLPLVEVFWKVGDYYKDLHWDAMCLNIEQNLTWDRAEAYYLMAIDLCEKDWGKGTKKIVPYYTKIQEFYSDFLNPYRSEEKAGIYYTYSANNPLSSRVGKSSQETEMEKYFRLARDCEVDRAYEQAITYYKKILEIEETEEKIFFYSHYNAMKYIILIQEMKGCYQEVIANSLKILEEEWFHDKDEKAVIHQILGRIYSLRGEIAKAKEQFETALEEWTAEREERGDKMEKHLLGCIMEVKVDMGEILEASQKDEAAEYYYGEAFWIYKRNFMEEIVWENSVARVFEGVSKVYKRKGCIKRALEYTRKAARINAESYDTTKREQALQSYLEIVDQYRVRMKREKIILLESYMQIGHLYKNLKEDYGKASIYYKKGLTLAIQYFGKENWQTAMFYDQLGDLCYTTLDGIYNENRIYFKKANYLAIAEYKIKAKISKEKIQKEDKEVKREAYEEAARNYEKADCYNKAIEMYICALKYIGTDKTYNATATIQDRSDLIRKISDLYEGLKQYEEAIEYAQNLLELGATQGEDYVRISDLYFLKGDVENALLNRLKALECYENNQSEKSKGQESKIELYTYLSKAYEKQGDQIKTVYYREKIKETIGRVIQI